MNLPSIAGITPGIPFDQYLELPGESASMLKKLAKSPLAYKWAKEHPDHTSSPAMALGTAVHTAVLEPHRMKTDYVLWDGGDKRGKAWTEFKELNAERSILSAAEFDQVKAMRASLLGYAPAARYLQDGVAEVTIQWKDPKTGRAMRGRVDWITVVDGQLVLVDLKTTRDASARKFFASSFDLGYHIQFAMYVDGWYYLTGETPRFVVLAVESSAPYEPAVFDVTEDVLVRGHDEYTALLEQLQACELTNTWPPRAEAEQPLLLPAWARAKDDEDVSDIGLDLTA